VYASRWRSSTPNRYFSAGLLGADIVITGSVSTWKDGNLFFMPTVGFEATCLSVKDSTVACSMSYSGEVFKAGMPERKAKLAAPDG